MAGLANVQNQIDILKGTDEFKKKSVLEPQNISDVRKFITEKKGQKGWEAHESSFQEWENLIANFNREKEKVTTATAQATANVGHTVIGANTSPVAIASQSTDIITSIASQKDLEEQLKSTLKSELTSLDGKLDKMSMDDLDTVLSITEKILSLSWIEKVPGMKEKAREIMRYEPMIQGIAGATIVKKLQNLGYNLYFTGQNQVKIVSNQADARDVELKLNGYLQKKSVLPKAIQTGVLFLNPSFSSFRESVLDSEGKIVNPNQVNIKSYTEYLRKKPQNTLDASEKIFLQSANFYDPKIDFQNSVIQSKEYGKVIGIMEQVTGDPSVRELLPKKETIAASPIDANSNPNSLAGQAGKGIGQIGGMIGKIAGAGAGGGMRVLGEVFSEATKHGGAWGSLAVIAGLIFSIWKGGFWKTLGGLFGIGLADAASRGELGGLGGAGNTNNKPKPETTATTELTSTGLGNTPRNVATEKPDITVKPLTRESLIARAMGREDIHDANVEAEKSVIDVMKGVNFTALTKALKEKTEPSWKAVKDSISYDKLSSEEKEKVDKILDPKNEKALDILSKIAGHASDNTHVKELTPEKRQIQTLDKILEYIVSKENEKKEEKDNVSPPTSPENGKTVPPPADILTLSDGHSNLYLLSRLVTQGYIPQLSDNTWSSGKDQPFYKRAISGMGYFVWDGGPLTNNKDSKNPLVGAWHNGLQEKVAAFTLAHTAEEKNMITEALTTMKSKTIDGSAALEVELMSRKVEVDEIEKILKSTPLDEKALKNALSSFEKSTKTKWEIIGNKLGIKWGANGWNIFKKTDIQAYINKANQILIDQKHLRDFGSITEDNFHAMYDEYKRGRTDSMVYQSGNDGKWYQVIDKSTTGSYKVQEVIMDAEGKIASNVGNTKNQKISTIVNGINIWLDKIPKSLEKIFDEANRIGAEIDGEKTKVISAFEAWEAEPKDANKKKVAMEALESYNKLVVEKSGLVSEGFSLLTKEEAKSLGAKAKSGGWLSEILHVNTTGQNFGWVDKVDKFTSETNYVKGARKTFIGVGLLSVGYNGVKGSFGDLVKDGKIGTALMSIADLGIGMVPFVGAAHDMAILTFEDYEKWILGAKMTQNERDMRKAFVILGVIPGVGIAIKGAGTVIKSSKALTLGSAVLHSGNFARSVATYSMLGMSIFSTTFDIAKKNSLQS